MSSNETSSLPFRSKKPLLRRSASKAELSVSDQPSSKTPEKCTHLPRRARNSGVALSVSEVRKAAESLRESKCVQPQDPADQIKSVRRQIKLPTGDVIASGSKNSGNGSAVELPEKYEMLCDFYASLDSSIRLLRLKGSKPTFANISRKIESLTDKRFTHNHLSQLKFILPEVIEIQRVRVFDESTSCMKAELLVTINVDTVTCDGKPLKENRNMSLRKLFRSRLADFLKSHPEANDVPEVSLPDPFNYPKQDHPSNVSNIESNTDTDATLVSVAQATNSQVNEVPGAPSHLKQDSQPAVAAHMSQSFRQCFSQKSLSNGAENTQQKPAEVILGTTLSLLEPSTKNNSLKEESKSYPTPSKGIEPVANAEGSSKKGDALESTPAKYMSTPSRLMTVTPALAPPKRSYMSPENRSSSSPNKLVRRPLKMSLKFDTPQKNEKSRNDFTETGSVSVDEDIGSILPENLLQSIREKERIAMEEQSPAISQAKRRKKMIACLPKLFNMINLLYHSMNRSVMTKEELLHKIISGHCDIVDRREIEEQLNLLLELVPEWISEKVASSGDSLCCINKMVNAEFIRTRLSEAK